MNITLFNKDYTVRRFDEGEVVEGYVTASYNDFKASLHIHPPSEETINALPEGERKIARLEGHGSVALRAADQDTGKKGDLLRYKDRWYECVSSVEFDHTLLSHYNYKFVLVPEDAADTPDTEYEEETEDEGEGS